jgi:hypothetical protein
MQLLAQRAENKVNMKYTDTINVTKQLIPSTALMRSMSQLQLPSMFTQCTGTAGRAGKIQESGRKKSRAEVTAGEHTPKQ